MKRIAALFLSMIALTVTFSASASSSTVHPSLLVKTYTLSNGLTVYINEDPNQISAFGVLSVKAGAADCPGTGIAHYFEHMMFKGTDKMNTIDYASEKVYLDSIAVMYDSLALTKDDAVRKDIQKEINRLSVKAADYAIPNEYDNLISEMGGTDLNAFTSYDETAYHNKFMPEYFAQWAELNSERVINPVFRLFQSELETVYEEKNRSNDNLTSDFMNKMLSSVFAGTGYSEEILGTTENLKNPRLSQMAQFFNDYYVASNMCLTLCGNLKAEECLPILEKTFGRIRKGTAPARPEFKLEAIKGKKDVEALMNIPLVKIGALCYQTPKAADLDAQILNFVVSMLNNDAQTGLLDKLMVEGKVSAAMAQQLSLAECSALTIIYMPKILFQSDAKAVKLLQNALAALRNGEFSDEFLRSCKSSYKKEFLSKLEDIENRSFIISNAFTNGLNWDEYLSLPDKIDALTREDIMAVANKYIGEDFIHIYKKKGIAPSDNLEKPGYDNVVPKNKDKSSAYAINLRKEAEHIKLTPRSVDFQNDVQIAQAAPMAKVFACKNPYNEIFDLTISYRIGTKERPELSRVASYASLLGTKDQSFDQIHEKLQELGAGLYFSADNNSFYVSVSGFDSNFEETVAIAADVLKNIKPEGKKLRTCRSDERSGRTMSRSDMSNLVDALYNKVLYGDKSPYFVDKGKFNDKTLLGAFHDVQKVECDITYSGGLDADNVASVVASKLDLDAVTIASNCPKDFDATNYDAPQVFFVDKKDASQSNINALIVSDPVACPVERSRSNLFVNYLGGGMSSLLFQEIREFRSMAYSTHAHNILPQFKNAADKKVVYRAFVGTQCDKTLDAIAIVDSLLTQTPFQDERLVMSKKELINDRCNSYPTFRERAEYVAMALRNGQTTDFVPEFMKAMETSNAETLKAFWQKSTSGHPIIWTIVGNSKNVDMDALSQIAPITYFKPKDLIK